MKIKRIISLVLLIVGIGCYFFAGYISGEVAEGRKKIASGQKTVDELQGLSKLSPYTKDIGEAATSSAQKKIDAGNYYMKAGFNVGTNPIKS